MCGGKFRWLSLALVCFGLSLAPTPLSAEESGLEPSYEDLKSQIAEKDALLRDWLTWYEKLTEAEKRELDLAKKERALRIELELALRDQIKEKEGEILQTSVVVGIAALTIGAILAKTIK